jgi:PAS domain S-box-containing protein
VSHRASVLPTETTYAALFDAAPDATIVMQASGRIVLVNRQADLLFGYEPGELLGQPIDLVVPEVSARVRATRPEVEAAFLADPSPRSVDPGLEPRGRRKDGSEFPAGISIAPLPTDDGLLISASIRDITDRKRFEGQRGRVEAQLVKAKSDGDQAKLEAQLHQAQRLESVGQLAGGIAHDFNNLLAAIMNYVALVSDCLHQQMDERDLNDDEAFVTIASDVDAITSVAQRAAVLTRQLLMFSRRQVVQPTVFDLNTVVGELEDMLRRTMGENVDDLQMVLADNLPLIRADRGQIDQVVMNLAVNARDAMPGGGRLRIETAAFEVDDDYARLHAMKPGTHVRLLVSDNGTGMTEDVVDRAFEPFFTTKPKGAGTGFGLATVYGIVRQAGGDVRISSDPGWGTTVQVELPATTHSAVPLRLPAPGAIPSAGGETILLVEDEVIIREPARRLLARRGYVVLVAGGAEEAIGVLRDHVGEVDLLLTDVVMPGPSGVELALEVGELSPATKVLFMSGYSIDVIAEEGVLEEGVSLIEKPFTADALLAKVRAVIDGGA